jgi:N-acetylglucosaminyldiphosphoundecaprenol N-acetyl-beta-D-mannosaminyltransferase
MTFTPPDCYDPVSGPIRYVLGTPLLCTSYRDLTARSKALVLKDRTWAVDLTNTQIVTARRHELLFRATTECVDLFVPDGMPLIWCLNMQGSKLKDRIYGPNFMRHCVLNSPAPITHYFLGGSDDCLSKLKTAFQTANPDLLIVGARNGYFKRSEESAIIEEINRIAPDFIWVGLGTPKQQEWIQRNKPRIQRGVVFAVGYAFDVNAGTKRDQPMWMQRLGLGWLFRLCSEPRRLLGRYMKYNSLFLFYLAWDAIRGKNYRKSPTHHSSGQ